MVNTKTDDQLFKIVRFLLYYSVLFCAVWFLSHFSLYINGKTDLYKDDCISVYYECRPFLGKWIESLVKGDFQWTNYNLSSDLTYFALNGIDVFDLVWPFTPIENIEFTFVFLNVFRIYLGGMGVMLLCLSKRMDYSYVVIGSMIYVSYGFVLFHGMVQPIFTTLFWITPFMFWGMERIITYHKGIFFSIIIGLSFLQGLFLTYYASIGLMFYYVAVVIEKGIGIKKVGRKTLDVGLYYMWGAAIGMPVIIPSVFETIRTQRLSHEIMMDVSLTSWIKPLVNDFFSIFLTSSKYTEISVLLLIPILYLITNRSKYRGYLYMIIVGWILLYQPYLRMIVGQSVANDRWNYCLGIMGAILFSGVMSEIDNHKDIPRNRMYIIALVYILLANLFLFREKGISLLFVNIVLVLGFAGMVLYLSSNSRRIREICLCAVLLLSVFMEGYYAYKRMWNVDNWVDRRNANGYLSQYADAAVECFDSDNELYRVDKSKFSDEMSCNLPYWYGFNGISTFTSFLNPYSILYYQITGNTGLSQINKYKALGGKITDELLANVKYYIHDNSDKTSPVPYGFEKIQSMGNNSVYKSKYNSVISIYTMEYKESDLYRLNPAQKEEVMLKALVISDDEKTNNESPRKKMKEFNRNMLRSSELEYEITNTNNINVDEEGYHIYGEKPTIELCIKEQSYKDLSNGELYVELENVKKEGKGQYNIKVSNQSITSDAQIGGKSYIRSSLMDSFCFNLGSYDRLSDGDSEVLIELPNGKMDISNVRVYYRDLSTIENDIECRNVHISDFDYGNDCISAQIHADNDGFLLFSVPYRKNWRCFVDGKPAETYRANIMYIAAEVTKGEHSIVLRYTPIYVYCGLIVSLISIILIVAVFSHNKKRSSLKTEGTDI